LLAQATQGFGEGGGSYWALDIGAAEHFVGLIGSAVLDRLSGAVIMWPLALLAVIIASIQSRRDPEARAEA
jgi:hypothetical protein